jgi:hypothetical protein
LQSDTQKAKRTAGEKRFDWLTYGGVGYAANVAISIGAMWAVDRTRGGKDFLYHSSHALSKLSGIEAKTLRPQIRYTALLTGGFAVLAPIKWLEDHKIEYVKQHDAEHYAAIPNAQEHLRTAYERLESEPRQSWGSILGSRMLAMVPFYAFTSLAMREGQWLARQTGGKVFGEKLITQAARGIDAALHSGDPKALAEIAAKNAKYPNYTVNSFIRGEMERPATALADYTITEAITSGMVAGFLYGFTRLTAPILGHKPEPKPFSPVAPVELLAPHSMVAAPTLSSQRLSTPAHHYGAHNKAS